MKVLFLGFLKDDKTTSVIHPRDLFDSRHRHGIYDPKGKSFLTRLSYIIVDLDREQSIMEGGAIYMSAACLISLRYIFMENDFSTMTLW